MAFNRECINLDPTRMDSDVIEHKTMKGAEKKVRKKVKPRMEERIPLGFLRTYQL